MTVVFHQSNLYGKPCSSQTTLIWALSFKAKNVHDSSELEGISMTDLRFKLLDSEFKAINLILNGFLKIVFSIPDY